MAVEASRIKGRLKELFPKANLSNKRLDEISARLAKKPADNAEDSEIDTVLNDMNELYPFEELAKDEHRLVTAENKAKNMKPDNGGEPTPPQDPPADPPKTEDMPAWAKAVLESNASLKKDLEEIKTGKIIESKKQTARQLFDQNETLKSLKETVKDKWFNRIDVNSETPVEDQIADLETEYTELVQVSADQRRSAGAPPTGGNGNGKPTDAELDAVVSGL